MRRAPRIPRGLARRLDRAARAAHAFHRLAHHPLCGAYAGEVVRIGRRGRLCRGCALALLGGTGGLLLGAVAPLSAPAALLLALAAAAAARLAVRPRRVAPPRSKLLTRLLPAALLGLAAASGARAASLAGAAAVAAAAAAVALSARAYRQRSPDRSPCEGCPEGALGPRCSGLAPIARRERAFGRWAGRQIEVAATPPRP